MNTGELRPDALGLKWMNLIVWAAKPRKGKLISRHRKVVLFLAEKAFRAEVALFCWRAQRGMGREPHDKPSSV